jgi:uncharacterized protein (TIGR02217 family)
LIPFDDVLLNPEYSALARGGPEFNNAYTQTIGGVPHVNINRWDYIGKYTIDYREMEETERRALRTFNLLRWANAYAFRFLAPDDYDDDGKGVLVDANHNVTNIVAGVTTYYMAKRYQDVRTYIRRIVKPAPGMITLKLGGSTIPLDGSQGITLDNGTGAFTFSLAAAAARAGLVPSWLGEFHIPAMFLNPYVEAAVDESVVSESVGLNITEVLPVAIGINV